MGLVVITGGARSGKSGVAERLAERCSSEVTVAVFGRVDDDPEMAARIERHRADRPNSWNVIEASDSVSWTEEAGAGVLLVDCLGTLLGMLIGETLADMGTGELAGAESLPSGFETELETRFAALVGWIVRRSDHTIAVTNEVGDGVVPAYATGRVFRDVLGRANRSLVDRSDKAYLVVSGRLIELTQLPTDGVWSWHEKGCD